MDVIYLDHNATTPIDPQVVEAMRATELAGLANPASQHQAGRAARRCLEAARSGIAELLGAKSSGMEADRLILTSGGTEANNLALFGLAGEPGGRILVSSIEHPSVLGAADQLARRGYDVQRIRVHSNGVLDLDHLWQLLEPGARLVSVMLANNETGVLQPVAEVVRLCADRRIAVHVDAAQVVGKLPVQFHSLGAALMTVTPHKFHGPVGIGALLVRHDVALQPLLFGGYQQLGMRPGTEPVALAVGFHRALQLWAAESVTRRKHMEQLRDLFERTLRDAIPNFVVHGESADRLPHVSSVSLVGLDRQSLLLALDRVGVCCSTGSACASGSSQPSTVLRAMGVPGAQLDSALRFSVSARTTTDEVHLACQRILRVVNDLRQLRDTGKSPPPPRQWTSERL